MSPPCWCPTQRIREGPPARLSHWPGPDRRYVPHCGPGTRAGRGGAESLQHPVFLNPPQSASLVSCLASGSGAGTQSPTVQGSPIQAGSAGHGPEDACANLIRSSPRGRPWKPAQHPRLAMEPTSLDLACPLAPTWTTPPAGLPPPPAPIQLSLRCSRASLLWKPQGSCHSLAPGARPPQPWRPGGPCAGWVVPGQGGLPHWPLAPGLSGTSAPDSPESRAVPSSWEGLEKHHGRRKG